MSLEEIIFYAEFSPPTGNETKNIRAYVARRWKDWTDCWVSCDNEDKKEFERVAKEIYFRKDGAPLTGADLKREAIRKEYERLRNLPVYFSTSFERHVFEGEGDGTKHKGLHSMVWWHGREPAATITRIEGDQEGTYSAWVTLPGKSDSKASSFFPDAWDRAKVKQAIKDAFVNSRLNRSESIRMAKEAGGLSWVGRVIVDGAELRIGGLGDGDKPGTGIQTAFPEVMGRFKDHNG